MAKKGKPGRPPGRKAAYLVYARVRPELGKLMAQYIDHTKPRPSQTAVIELALEEFFTTRGLLQPPPAPEE